jgi:hypothetical protein
MAEWLSALCTTEPPEESVVVYDFGLFESSVGNVIFLVGSKEYRKGQLSISKIDFEPTDMYFNLPADEYGSLNSEEVKAKLLKQIIEFTKTDQFRNSFFNNAKLILTDFGGKVWPN